MKTNKNETRESLKRSVQRCLLCANYILKNTKQKTVTGKNKYRETEVQTYKERGKNKKKG